ncbi:MAG: LON peptidase substrate-binding domain-containing protein [Vicinamibacterales bacterium]|nr:LON peptidase substrate-binding domain-containing protein [Vicinamibacterales bacterium]
MPAASSLPLFPLPTVVLFPNVFLPLHIFEPRYRQMVSDALNGDRMIGIVLLKPGFEAEYEGQPAVYDVGCSGLITHVERLPEQRFNIVLRGLEKFRIVAEDDPAGSSITYRRGLVTPLGDPLPADARDTLTTERRRLEALLRPSIDRLGAESPLPQAMPDDDLVNALAQYLEFEPIEKQALLECDGPLARCRAMIELLEMKALLDQFQGGPSEIH